MWEEGLKKQKKKQERKKLRLLVLSHQQYAEPVGGYE